MIESIRELGINTLSNHADGDDEFFKLAQRMFDTKLPPGVTLMSPFAEDSSLKKVSVKVHNILKMVIFIIFLVSCLIKIC